ncbi:MAG TPA: response regulator transcription factor [Candidatus Paceibacterota bacterium]|nr:response regulator transcription factor [Candidatus Paceibacterota bacterium]
MNTKTEIRLMVVDDHSAFRRGLVSLLESEAGMLVVAQTGSGDEAIRLYRQFQPDVVLMDLRLPGISGVEAIMTIRKEFPKARFVVITTYDTDEDIYRAMQAGAQSYLLKDMSDDDVLSMIRMVHAGEAQLPKNVAGRLAERMKREELTRREMEVLELLVKGRSNKEIGDLLGVSEAAVKFRLKGLFLKLGVKDRTEAVVSALRHGIFHLQ